MKFKKTSAALLVATMTVAGSSYAWASEGFFKPAAQTSENTINTTTADSATLSTEDTAAVTIGDGATSELKFPEIPEDYKAGNLLALQKAFENAGNDTAKSAIVRNAERAIVKFEAKQEALKQEQTATEEVTTEKTETTVEEKITTAKPITTTPVPAVEQKEAEARAVKQPIVEEQPKASAKEERQALSQQQKEERNTLKEEHKTEKQAFKQEQKNDQQSGKEKE